MDIGNGFSDRSVMELVFLAMQGSEKQGKVSKLTKSEMLMLNIGSMCTGARIIAVSWLVEPSLTSSVCSRSPPLPVILNMYI